jgi:hypothetical protein
VRACILLPELPDAFGEGDEACLRHAVTAVLGKLLPLRSGGRVIRRRRRRRWRPLLHESENFGIASAFGKVQRCAVTARRARRYTVGIPGDEQADEGKMAEFDRTSECCPAGSIRRLQWHTPVEKHTPWKDIRDTHGDTVPCTSTIVRYTVARTPCRIHAAPQDHHAKPAYSPTARVPQAMQLTTGWSSLGTWPSACRATTPRIHRASVSRHPQRVQLTRHSWRGPFR